MQREVKEIKNVMPNGKVYSKRVRDETKSEKKNHMKTRERERERRAS